MENIAAAIRSVPGFGGKGFRMKEIVLDLSLVAQTPQIEDQGVFAAQGSQGSRPTGPCAIPETPRKTSSSTSVLWGLDRVAWGLREV